MLRYMQALAKVVIKNPVLWAVILICQLMLLAPFVRGDDTEGYLQQDVFRSNDLYYAQQNMRDGYEGMSDEEIKETQQRYGLITRAANTDDPREYAELRAELAAMEAQMTKEGRLSGGSLNSYLSSQTFYERLSELDDPRIYESYRDEPALFYLAHAYDGIPLFMWMLPSLVATASLMRAVRGRCLLAQAPIGRIRAQAAHVVLAVGLAWASLMLIALPSFIVPLAVNGLGEAAYPVINVVGIAEHTIAESTVGQVLPQAALMMGVIALFVSLLALAVASVMPERMVVLGPLAAGCFLATPIVQAYMQRQSIAALESSTDVYSDPFVPLNPLTYLDLYGSVAGHANYWSHTSILQDERLTLGLGCTVLMVCAVVFLAVAFTAASLRGMRLARKDDRASPAPGADATGLLASHLVLAYGKRRLLDDASCQVGPGEVVGLIAPNGSGKTTLLEALVAFGTTRRAGCVSVNGVPSADPAFRTQVLYVPCDAGLLYPNLTAADHIKLAAALWPDKVDTRKLIELCGLEGYLNKPVRAYSSGMKQQLALAVAYCTGARYLLLDEPMNALDPGNVALNTYILRRLAAQGTGVLLSSHILSNLDELCESVLCIHDGALERIARGDVGAADHHAQGEQGAAGHEGAEYVNDTGCHARDARGAAEHVSVRAIYEQVFGKLRTYGEAENRAGVCTHPQEKGGRP